MLRIPAPRRRRFSGLPPVFVLLPTIWALALFIVGCAEEGDRPLRNVVLVSIDTLRADHLSAYGYGRSTSPTLDGLAADGVLFSDASSTSPWTLPAHASLLTGRYPGGHGLKSTDVRLPAEVATLAEILNRSGFETAAFVNSHYLSARYGLHRGFETFEYVPELPVRATPSEVGERATRWLMGTRERPFFLFVHFYDVHSDYLAQPRYRSEFERSEGSRADGTTAQLLRVRAGVESLTGDDVEHVVDLYDAGIRQMDDGIARLLGALERAGHERETLVIVTSDHGEEFMDHGGVLHGRTQYQELIQVPLILRGPGLPRGLRVQDMVSLVDVAPTVLSLLDLPTPSGADGVDLRPLWSGGAVATRLLFSEADHNNAEDDIKRAVRHPRFKLHHDTLADRWALYDLEADPGETRDVQATEGAMARFLREQLQQYMRAGEVGDAIPPLGPDEIERLEKLGYLR